MRGYSRRRVKQEAIIIGEVGEVNNERLQYDNRNTNKKAVEIVSADTEVIEVQKKAVEFVTAAFAAEVMETAKKAVALELGEVSANEFAIGKRATDDTTVVGSVTEFNRKAIDDIAAEFAITEQQKKAVEDISNTVTATANESAKRAVEIIEGAIIARTDLNQKATDIGVVEVTLNGYANQNVQTTTWTNPANALNDTTNTSASLTATASGLAGTTNNTATGILSVGFRDVNLGDLTITSVTLQVENSGAGAGVAVAQPTANIQYQYSLNNGSTWTTFFTHNTPALAKGIRTVDITGIIGQDQSLLSALQIRATGSVTSGTGLGAAYTASFFRAWMTVLANRTYN